MDDCASGWNRDTKSVCVPGKVPWSNFTENCFLFCSKHCDLDTGKMAILIILIYITVKFNQLETAACIAPEMFFPAPTSTPPPPRQSSTEFLCVLLRLPPPGYVALCYKMCTGGFQCYTQMSHLVRVARFCLFSNNWYRPRFCIAVRKTLAA